MNKAKPLFQALSVLIVPFFILLATAQLSFGQHVAELDSIFQSWDSSATPGCAVGVSEEGRPVATRAWGMADLENPVRNTPSTIFEAGSVSKQFVSASVILLSLDGKLSLDDDVRKYIPELPEYGHTITLRHLLTHTSGLRDWGSVASISGWGRSNRTHNHDHVLDILSRQTQLNFPPGKRYSYSNSGYNLLAMVVERVSGSSFAEYSTEHIFEPLGMTSTQWRDDYTRIVQGRSSAYSGSEGDEVYTINRPIEHVHGNGGLLTTVGDLLAWKHARSSGYFGEEFNHELTRQGRLESGRTIAYASGVRIDSDHGRPQIVHTGATSGYRAYLSLYPEQDLAVAILCNVTGAGPGSLGSAVSKLYLGEEASETDDETPNGISLDSEKLEAKTGVWADPRNHRATEIVLENDTLQINGGSDLVPLSENEFQVGSSETTYKFIESGDQSRPSVIVIREGYSEEVLRPVNWAEEGSIDLADYTGTFESRDAETVIKLTVDDGELIAHRRPADTFELEPLYEDTFTASGFGLIRFFRNEQGNVIRFAYSSGRVYNMNFSRIRAR